MSRKAVLCMHKRTHIAILHTNLHLFPAGKGRRRAPTTTNFTRYKKANLLARFKKWADAQTQTEPTEPEARLSTSTQTDPVIMVPVLSQYRNVQNWRVRTAQAEDVVRCTAARTRLHLY